MEESQVIDLAERSFKTTHLLKYYFLSYKIIPSTAATTLAYGGGGGVYMKVCWRWRSVMKV